MNLVLNSLWSLIHTHAVSHKFSLNYVSWIKLHITCTNACLINIVAIVQHIDVYLK